VETKTGDVLQVVTSKKKGFWRRSDDIATKNEREKQKRRKVEQKKNKRKVEQKKNKRKEEQKKNKRRVKQRKKIRGKGKTQEQHVIEILRQSYLDSLDVGSEGGDVPRRVKTCFDDDNSSVTMSRSSILNDLDDSSTISLTLTGMNPDSVLEEPRRKSSRLAPLLAYLRPILPMFCCAYPEYVDRPIPRILSITSTIQDDNKGTPMKKFSVSSRMDDDMSDL
jgi:hypothetical protein